FRFRRGIPLVPREKGNPAEEAVFLLRSADKVRRIERLRGAAGRGRDVVGSGWSRRGWRRCRSGARSDGGVRSGHGSDHLVFLVAVPATSESEKSPFFAAVVGGRFDAAVRGEPKTARMGADSFSATGASDAA